MLANTTDSITETIVLALVVVILIGPFVARELHLPTTIGLVLGGAVIGPEGIGWLEAGQLDGLGDLGLLYLMFLAGLELDMDLFRRYRTAALQFGALSFAFPFVFGIIAGSALDYTRPAAILLGSIWASHTLISLPEVKQFGLSGNRAVAVTVSATALTDTASLIVLAGVTSGAADEPGSSALVELVIGLGLLGAYTLWVLPRIGQWAFRTLALERTNRLVFMLGAFSSAALLAQAFGIEGLVGAFLAGIGVNRLAPAGGALAERVEFFGSALFVPAFLVFVGTQLDLAALASWDTLGLAAIFVGVVVAGKVSAAALIGWRKGFTVHEVGVMSGLSIGQAAATLAATLVGQQVGLFDDEVVNGVLVAVLVTILLSSLVTTFFARRVPAERAIERPLLSKIVVAVPAGGAEDRFLHIVGRIASRASAEVVAVRVVETGVQDGGRNVALAELDAAAASVNRAGADVETILRVDTSNEDGVINVIHEQEASLLVLSPSGSPTVAQRLFGDPIERIGKRSPIPLVVGHVPEQHFERAVLVIDAAPGDAGIRADAEVGALLLASIVAVHDGIGAVLVSDRSSHAPVEELSLPEDVVVEPAAEIDESWFASRPATDLLIVTSGLLHRSGLRTRDLTERNVGMLLVAGPHRLGRRTPIAPPAAEGMLGYTGHF